MKRFWLIVFSLLLIFPIMAQMQNGVVKTRGRMVNNKYVPGVGLPGAVVSIKDRTDVVVKNNDGSFSFPIRDKQFMVQSVTKMGYALVDADAAPKTYLHSQDTIFFVMDTPDQILQDKLDSERRIRRTLRQQLQAREDEIERLKSENKITQEEYHKALQKLYADEENNEKLIQEMAKRYSTLDYDRIDESHRQVGEGHPDVANSYIGIGHKYYSLGDYTKALEYYQRALVILIKVFGPEHPDVAFVYNNIGQTYHSQGDYTKALEYYQKALDIQVKVFGEEHPNVIQVKENIESIKQLIKTAE